MFWAISGKLGGFSALWKQAVIGEVSKAVILAGGKVKENEPQAIAEGKENREICTEHGKIDKV